MVVYGETSTGKTTFALSAPGPIALFTANEKLDGIIQPFAQEKEIRIFNFALAAGDKKKGSPKWGEVQEALSDAVTWARTIIIDTDSEMYEAARYFHFGKLTQVKPHHYAGLNADWKKVFDSRFRGMDKAVNLIAVSKLKERYKNNKPTGVMVPQGQSDMPYMADVVVRTQKTKKGEYTLEIKKGWMNDADTQDYGELEGMEFGSLMELVTETPEEEWT